MMGRLVVVEGRFVASNKFVWSKFRKLPTVVRATQMDVPFQVETLEGWSKGKVGDWLVEGVLGELYPCNDAVFQASYEPLEERDENLLKSD